jgi:hypothetical protein
MPVSQELRAVSISEIDTDPIPYDDVRKDVPYWGLSALAPLAARREPWEFWPHELSAARLIVAAKLGARSP